MNLRRGKDGVVAHPDGRGGIQNRVRASSVSDCSPALTRQVQYTLTRHCSVIALSVIALFHGVRHRDAFHSVRLQACVQRHETQLMPRRSTGASIRLQTTLVSKRSQINTRGVQQALKHARPRAKSNQRTAQAAVRVRGAVRLAAQELLSFEFVLGLAVGTEGEELVVELARAPVPHADGAQRLEHVREVGSALRHAPVEDGGRDCPR